MWKVWSLKFHSSIYARSDSDLLIQSVRSSIKRRSSSKLLFTPILQSLFSPVESVVSIPCSQKHEPRNMMPGWISMFHLVFSCFFLFFQLDLIQSSSVELKTLWHLSQWINQHTDQVQWKLPNLFKCSSIHPLTCCHNHASIDLIASIE